MSGESERLVERLRSLLESEEALAPLEQNDRKKLFLASLLKNQASVLAALKESKTQLTEFLLWRRTDELFEYLYNEHVRAVDEDIAADLRKSAKSADASLAQKVSAIQVLNPDYDRAIKKEQAKGVTTKKSYQGRPMSIGVDAEIEELASRPMVADPLDSPLAATHDVDLGKVLDDIPAQSLGEQVADLPDDPITVCAKEAAKTFRGQALLQMAGLK